MRKPIVLGNWKLNGSMASTEALVAGVLSGLGGLDRIEVGVCPPCVYIPKVVELASGTDLRVGGQTSSEHQSGAFTGEVAADMLRDVGCHYVLVGHSERRTLYGETDSIVADKVQAALHAGLMPVLCVGETLEERDAGQAESVVQCQLDAVLDKVGVGTFERIVMAYEPVWAIGTGRTATPDQAQAMHATIRKHIAGRDEAVARRVRLQYGGSVKADNAAEHFAQVDIDGGLIGGASLKAEDFLAICRAAADTVGK